jgi:glycosyltransferase involved in cell wall biosynthesis
VTFHGSDLHVASRSVLARIKIRLAVRYADAVTAVSRPMADCLRDRFHATAVKCIPNGVDTTIGSDADQHCPPGVQPDHFVFVGRLHPTKRVPLLVETYKACVDAGCDRNLYIIGDGEDRDVVARLIETYELRDRIVLVGAMSHREALAAVASARCVVLFSSHEGCPTVVLESMAAGVPVVATCAGGIPDLVADRDTGFLFPADQPQQAIGSMLYLAHHPLEARDMGRRAREVARNRFELADTIQQYMALYERFNDSAATTPVR